MKHTLMVDAATVRLVSTNDEQTERVQEVEVLFGDLPVAEVLIMIEKGGDLKTASLPIAQAKVFVAALYNASLSWPD